MESKLSSTAVAEHQRLALASLAAVLSFGVLLLVELELDHWLAVWGLRWSDNREKKVFPAEVLFGLPYLFGIFALWQFLLRRTISAPWRLKLAYSAATATFMWALCMAVFFAYTFFLRRYPI